jgi:hypothetical protein
MGPPVVQAVVPLAAGHDVQAVSVCSQHDSVTARSASLQHNSYSSIKQLHE